MLTLVFGGAAQGLEDYAVSLCGDREVQMLTVPEKATAEAVVLSGWEEWVRAFAQREESELLDESRVLLEGLRKEARDYVFCMTECGCGIVPLGAEERLHRERCGLLLRLLSDYAERVDRVMAGIGICLKGCPEEKGKHQP